MTDEQNLADKIEVTQAVDDLHECWTCRHKTWCEITHSSRTEQLYRCVNCKAIYPLAALRAAQPPADVAGLVERLQKTATILRVQADLASRIAATYGPEREKWEVSKGDDRLTAMIRYQLDQEALARSLTKDADEAEQAAATLTTLSQRIAELETILVQENPPLTNAALKKRIAELEAENARLREALATMANSINIVGSHYDHAVQALDALVRSIKTQARAALKGGRDD